MSRPEGLPPLPGTDPPHEHGIRGLLRDLRGLDLRLTAMLAAVPVVLTVMEYYGLPWHYTRHVMKNPRIEGTRLPPFAGLFEGLELPGPEAMRPYLWWGICCILLMVLLPMLVGAVAGLSPRRLGLRIRGTGRDAWIYLVLFALFFPVIWLVSRSPEFRQTYPFYKPTPQEGLRGSFLVFEGIYCAQFFAIEFFFRGFMVLGLKPWLGRASILVMLAPYCMVHYYKPFPEALGAIGAGLVLGTLSWRTGTILYGWFLHYAVALSMDLLALHGAGRLG